MITQSAYAKQRGVSREAVRQAIAAGRIILIDGKIDPDVADVQWERNTRPRLKASPPHHDPAPLALSPSPQDPAPAADSGLYDLHLARAKREHHEANIAEMRERQRAGELVELREVELAYTSLAAQLRAAIERIPDKLATRMAAETDENIIHTLLMDELDAALDDMAQTAQQLPVQLTRDIG